MGTPNRVKLPLWVGIGHRKGMGKDLCGSILVESLRDRGYNACIAKFATAPKCLVTQLFSKYGVRSPGHYERHREERDVVLPRVDKSWRQIMEGFAHGLRDVYGNVWVDELMEDPLYFDADVVVVTDMRYPNEMQAIKDRGGINVRLNRFGIPHSDSKPETALDPTLVGQWWDAGLSLPLGNTVETLRQWTQGTLRVLVEKTLTKR